MLLATKNHKRAKSKYIVLCQVETILQMINYVNCVGHKTKARQLNSKKNI